MTETAVFLYDGDCAFCARCIAFLTRRFHSPSTIVAWQTADLAALGVSEADCIAAVQWIASGHTHAGPAAFAHLLQSATQPRDRLWRTAGRILALRLVLAVAWPVYRLVARHRHQLPGAAPSCAVTLPQPRGSLSHEATSALS